MRELLTSLALGLWLSVVGFFPLSAHAEDATPTPEEYVGHVGGDSQLLPPG